MRRCNILVIAVKPHLVAGVLSEVTGEVTKGHLVLSIAAGVTLADMSEVNDGWLLQPPIIILIIPTFLRLVVTRVL